MLYMDHTNYYYIINILNYTSLDIILCLVDLCIVLKPVSFEFYIVFVVLLIKLILIIQTFMHYKTRFIEGWKKEITFQLN